MARQNRDTKAIDNTVARNRLRSSLFHWMVKRHDDLAERWGDGKVDWRTACEEFVELGLTDTRGKAATERNARETWLQARKHVSAKRAKAAEQPPPRINPSRLPKDWRPANAPPPTTQLFPAAAGSHSLQDLMPANRKNPADKDDGYDPKARKASLLRLIAERSGH
jgi:hypothetical protein